jgi:hypothetical protein
VDPVEPHLPALAVQDRIETAEIRRGHDRGVGKRVARIVARGHDDLLRHRRDVEINAAPEACSVLLP